MIKGNRINYLLKNTAIFAIGNFASKIINFILVPLYTYMLTVSEYGTIDLITTLGMLLVPLCTLNISEGIIRFSLDKNADHIAIMSLGIILLIFSTITSGLMTLVLTMNEGLADYSIYIFFYTISIASSQLFLGYLRGREQLVCYTWGNILNTFMVALLNVLFLVVFKLGIKGYFLAIVISNIITSVYAISFGDVVNVLKNFGINIKLTKDMLKYSIVLIPNAFMWWIMNSADRIVVTSVLGVAANGIFAIAYKIPSLMSTIAGIFNQAWSFSAIKENESEDREVFTNRIYDCFFMIISLSALGMLAILKPFLSLYVNDSYYIAWKYVPLLVLGFVFQSLSSFLATPYTVNKDSKGFLYSATLGSCINIFFNFILIYKFGLNGVAFATCFSYFGVFIYRFNDTKKYVKVNVFNCKYIIVMSLIIIQIVLLYCNNIIFQVAMFIILILGFIFQYETVKPIINNLLRMLGR